MIYSINKDAILEEASYLTIEEASYLLEEAGKASMRKKGIDRKDKKFEDIKASPAHKERKAEYPLHEIVPVLKKDMRQTIKPSSRGGLPSAITSAKKAEEAVKKAERESYKLTTSKESKFENAKKNADSTYRDNKAKRDKEAEYKGPGKKGPNWKALAAAAAITAAGAGAAANEAMDDKE